MHNLHRCVMLILAGFAIFAGAINAQDIKLRPQKLDRRAPKADDLSLPVSPLRLKGKEFPEIDMGRTFKLSSRIMTIQVENPSDKPVEYTGVVKNCNCMTILPGLPSSGVIPPKGVISFRLMIDGKELKVEKDFFRMVRFELKGYRHFKIGIVGQLSKDLYMYFGDDPEQVRRTKITVGYISDPTKPWETTLHFGADLPNGEKIELKNARCAGSFQAALYQHADNRWSVRLMGVNPMEVGRIKAGLVLDVVYPNRPEGQGNGDMERIILPIDGICGAQINATVYSLHNDPQKDPQVVTKRIMLDRQTFKDPRSIAAAFLGRPNPYQAMLKMLTADEIILPEVKGVTFKLVQGKYGVFVDCTMDRSQMTEAGEKALFKVKNGYDKPAEVRFAILGEKERAEIEAKRKQREEEQKAEEAAQKEQDAIK